MCVIQQQKFAHPVELQPRVLRVRRVGGGFLEVSGRGDNPLRLALVPDDLAGAYVFLASRRDAKGITGTIVTVDAGTLLRAPRAS